MWIRITYIPLVLFLTFGCTNSKFEAAKPVVDVTWRNPKSLICASPAPANREVLTRCFNNQENLVQNFNVNCINGIWIRTPASQNSFTCPVQNCLNGLASPVPRSPTISACAQGIGNITTNYSYTCQPSGAWFEVATAVSSCSACTPATTNGQCDFNTTQLGTLTCNSAGSGYTCIAGACKTNFISINNICSPIVPTFSWVQTPDPTIYYNSSQVLTFSALPVTGTSVVCKVNGSIRACANPPNQIAIAEQGVSNVVVEVTHASGQKVISSTKIVNIDTIAPLISLDTSTTAPPAITGENINYTFKISSNEPSIAYIVFEIVGEVAPTNILGLLLTGQVSIGSHVAKIKAVDWAGNVSNTITYQWQVTAPIPQGPQLFFKASDPRLGHNIGLRNGDIWELAAASGTTGFLTFGPYITDLPVGVSTVTFSLLVDQISTDNAELLTLDVFDLSSGRQYAKRMIRRSDFRTANSVQDFDLVFETSGATKLEFRIQVASVAWPPKIQHVSTEIRPDKTNLDSLWNGQSHFEFKKRDVFSSSLSDADWDGNTSSLVTLDGIWYAFNRQPYGVAREFLRTVVRKSTNRGLTWSAASIIASPANYGAPPDNRYITDGSAFYDTETSVWHLLSQCLGNTGGWSLCHYFKLGISPINGDGGIWYPNYGNDPNTGQYAPAVPAGSLWSRICSGVGKHCTPDTHDEGTPQIIKKENGYFYVSFHGYRSYDQTGYRGIARTTDFKTWETEGADLPNDAMQSSLDCRSWIGGCIGVGVSSTIRSSGKNYTLIEAADKGLGCQAGQRWEFGLMRSTSYSKSGTWENYGSNSFVANENIAPGGCALQYMNFIRDRGEIYLMFGFYSLSNWYPNNTYQLVPGAGPLRILVPTSQ